LTFPVSGILVNDLIEVFYQRPRLSALKILTTLELLKKGARAVLGIRVFRFPTENISRSVVSLGKLTREELT
jgi:hypothetical protein